MARQYVVCRFRGSGRGYTYHNDGDPVAVGDDVKVNSSEGIATVKVTAITGKPNFETKPIIGKA